MSRVLLLLLLVQFKFQCRSGRLPNCIPHYLGMCNKNRFYSRSFEQVFSPSCYLRSSLGNIHDLLLLIDTMLFQLSSFLSDAIVDYINDATQNRIPAQVPIKTRDDKARIQKYLDGLQGKLQANGHFVGSQDTWAGPLRGGRLGWSGGARQKYSLEESQSSVAQRSRTSAQRSAGLVREAHHGLINQEPAFFSEEK